MKAEAAALEGFKLSIGPGRINQKLAIVGHLPWHGHFSGSAGDRVRLRGLSFAGSAGPAIALVDLCRDARIRLGRRYRDGFSHPGVTRKYPAPRRGRLHP